LNPKWSHDGRQIAFTSDSGGRGFEAWILALKTGEFRQLTYDGVGTSVSDWSPNGKWLALTKGGNVWILPVRGEPAKQLTFHSGPVFNGEAVWSPDGARLAFTSTRTGDGEIWLMDIDGENTTRLTFHPAYDGGPAWSPDGKQIAFTSYRTIYPEIWLLEVPKPLK
jgi:Tol biopolymer transport system component